MEGTADAVTGDETTPPSPDRRRRRTEKTAEWVAREILSDIVDRELEPGSKLAPQAEMLEDFQVGRASLREALRILETHGLITIKPGPGGGPVVSGVHGADFGRMATVFLHASGATFRELVAARLVIEPLMARQAAERQSRDAPPELHEALQRSREVSDDGDRGYISASTSFHDVVTSHSGNRVLDLIARALKEIYVERIREIAYEPSERARILEAHEAIADAILAGDGDTAETLMREHMVEYVEVISAKFPGVMDETVEWR
ncbi:MAG: FCD domain-containing protein [Acidimicrobiales bacterium]